MHPAALCESVRNDGLDYEFGWVGFFKPEVVPDLPKKCQSVYAMARYAMERGATAILVDIDGLVAAQEELFEEVAAQDLLKRPVVVLFPAQATKLQSIIIRRPMVIHARIELPPARDHFDLGIFLTCFFLIVLVCLAIVVKMRWRRNNKQNTLAQQAKRALNKMECRRYKEKKKDEKQRIKEVEEEEGEEVVVVVAVVVGGVVTPRKEGKKRKRKKRRRKKGKKKRKAAMRFPYCRRDLRCAWCAWRSTAPTRSFACCRANTSFTARAWIPWLLQHRTCPLCNYNIIEGCYESPPATCTAAPPLPPAPPLYSTPPPGQQAACGHPGCPALLGGGYSPLPPGYISPPPGYSSPPLAPMACTGAGGVASGYASPALGLQHAHHPHASFLGSLAGYGLAASCGYGAAAPAAPRGFGGGCGHASCLMYPPAPTHDPRCGHGHVPPPHAAPHGPPPHGPPPGSSSEETEHQIVSVEVQHHGAAGPRPVTFQAGGGSGGGRGPLPAAPLSREQLAPFLAALAALQEERRGGSEASDASSSLDNLSCEVLPPSSPRRSLESLQERTARPRRHPQQESPPEEEARTRRMTRRPPWVNPGLPPPPSTHPPLAHHIHTMPEVAIAAPPAHASHLVAPTVSTATTTVPGAVRLSGDFSLGPEAASLRRPHLPPPLHQAAHRLSLHSDGSSSSSSNSSTSSSSSSASPPEPPLTHPRTLKEAPALACRGLLRTLTCALRSAEKTESRGGVEAMMWEVYGAEDLARHSKARQRGAFDESPGETKVNLVVNFLLMGVDEEKVDSFRIQKEWAELDTCGIQVQKASCGSDWKSSTANVAGNEAACWRRWNASWWLPAAVASPLPRSYLATVIVILPVYPICRLSQMQASVNQRRPFPQCASKHCGKSVRCITVRSKPLHCVADKDTPVDILGGAWGPNTPIILRTPTNTLVILSSPTTTPSKPYTPTKTRATNSSPKNSPISPSFKTFIQQEMATLRNTSPLQAVLSMGSFWSPHASRAALDSSPGFPKVSLTSTTSAVSPWKGAGPVPFSPSLFIVQAALLADGSLRTGGYRSLHCYR
ncbi:hypothetical protein O3P69_014934 [Scylla paramamosain]|uniref:RING-type E3 ubiquitin transferase n=1 Tax=Scylla paramamosain TaxID=85552 RepID=A0AAW0U1N3_SCYPA